jgi:hypothetical protein
MNIPFSDSNDSDIAYSSDALFDATKKNVSGFLKSRSDLEYINAVCLANLKDTLEAFYSMYSELYDLSPSKKISFPLLSFEQQFSGGRIKKVSFKAGIIQPDKKSIGDGGEEYKGLWCLCTPADGKEPVRFSLFDKNGSYSFSSSSAAALDASDESIAAELNYALRSADFSSAFSRSLESCAKSFSEKISKSEAAMKTERNAMLSAFKESNVYMLNDFLRFYGAGDKSMETAARIAGTLAERIQCIVSIDHKILTINVPEQSGAYVRNIIANPLSLSRFTGVQADGLDLCCRSYFRNSTGFDCPPPLASRPELLERICADFTECSIKSGGYKTLSDAFRFIGLTADPSASEFYRECMNVCGGTGKADRISIPPSVPSCSFGVKVTRGLNFSSPKKPESLVGMKL